MKLEELVESISEKLDIKLKQSNSHYEGCSSDTNVEMCYSREDKALSLTKTHTVDKKEDILVKEIGSEFEISYITFYGDLAALRFGNVNGSSDPLLTSMSKTASEITDTGPSNYSSGVVVKHRYHSLDSAMGFINFIIEGLKEEAYKGLASGVN